MSASEDGRPHRRKPGCALRCLGVGCFGVLVALASVYGLFLYNNRPPNIVIPTTPMPADNAYDDINRACAMLTGRKHLFPIDMENYNPATYTLDDYGAAYADSLRAIELMRRSLHRPYQAPAARTESGVSAAIRHNGAIREMARTLEGAAEYEEKISHARASAELLLDGIELSVKMRKGGGLPEAMSGVQQICAYPFEPLLPKLAAFDLAPVAARLDRIAAERVPHSDVVLEEGRMTAAIWRSDPARGSRYYVEMRSILHLPNDRPADLTSEWRALRYTMANRATVINDYLKWTAALSAEARAPYTGRSLVRTPDNIMAVISVDLYRGLRRSLASQDAVLDLLRLEVALLRYRADHRRYPDRLADLEPTYLKSIPFDPCGGAANVPFTYRLTDGGRTYILYSRGPNLKDDGGRPLRYPTLYEPGDIVAGQIWPRRTP